MHKNGIQIDHNKRHEQENKNIEMDANHVKSKTQAKSKQKKSNQKQSD